jgi:hypothetical protein
MYPQVFENKLTHSSGLSPAESKLSIHVTLPDFKKANWFFGFYFLLAIGGGALRKWVFTEGLLSNLVLLALMVAPLFFFALKQKGIRSPFTQFGLLYGLMAFLIYQIINPYQKTFYHGLLGFLVYAPFWLSIFFLMANRHAFQLYRLRWLFISLALVQVALCFVQYALPPAHFLNKYAVERDAGIAMVGDAVRVTGTFSFLSGLTAYTVFHAFLCWAMLRWRFPPLVFFSFLLAGLILCFMSGSRSGTLIYLGLSAGIILHEFPPQLLGRFLFRYLLPVMLFLWLIFRLGSGPVFDGANRAIDNFVQRTTNLQKKGEQASRLFGALNRFNNLNNFPEPILGVGAGATYQGATILFGKSKEVIQFGYYESEFVQLFLEGGVVLLMLRIALVITLLNYLPFGLFMKLFLFVCIMYGLPIVFNVYNAAFLMMGIALVDNTIYWQHKAKSDTVKNQ